MKYRQTRFRPHAQDAPLRAFKGYPAQIPYKEFLISHGVEYLLKHYDSAWVFDKYRKIYSRSKITGGIDQYEVISHEVISPLNTDVVRYVIAVGEEVLYDRDYNMQSLLSGGFIMYAVLLPRAKRWFMLPNEYESIPK